MLFFNFPVFNRNLISFLLYHSTHGSRHCSNGSGWRSTVERNVGRVSMADKDTTARIEKNKPKQRNNARRSKHGVLSFYRHRTFSEHTQFNLPLYPPKYRRANYLLPSVCACWQCLGCILLHFIQSMPTGTVVPILPVAPMNDLLLLLLLK